MRGREVQVRAEPREGESEAGSGEEGEEGMKVVFLDVDGVLVNLRSLAERKAIGSKGQRYAADPACVEQLNRITRETGAVIVVSSSWRFCGVEEMRLILKAWNVEAEMIDITPDLTRVPDKIGGLYEAVPRGAEIAAWMADNGEPEGIAIIDDDSDMHPLLHCLVKTEFEHGLTEANADHAISLLLSRLWE